MQVKFFAECSKFGEHSAILSTFIKLPFVIKILVLSIFGWRVTHVFTVQAGRQTDIQIDFTARDHKYRNTGQEL